MVYVCVRLFSVRSPDDAGAAPGQEIDRAAHKPHTQVGELTDAVLSTEEPHYTFQADVTAPVSLTCGKRTVEMCSSRFNSSLDIC